jgi:hypothetical protein
MREQRTIEGRGVLVCGDIKTKVTYKLTLLSGPPGDDEASGSLHVADASIPIKAIIAGACRLILEGKQEVAVHVTRSDVHGNAYVQTSGAIPTI